MQVFGTDVSLDPSRYLSKVENAILRITDVRSHAATAPKPMSASIRSRVLQVEAAMGQNGTAQAIANQKPPTTKEFRVQFNPSELQLDATVHPDPLINLTNQGQASTQNSVQPGSVILTVRLIFDKVVVTDCFMGAKFAGGLSASGIAGAANTVMSALGKRTEPTVRTEVEGLIAALRNKYTRLMEFCWADFHFKGTLRYVNAEYTMFSIKGEPVRAKVTLRIEQQLEREMLQATWYRDYEQAFGASSVSSMVQTGQKFGNLIQWSGF